MIDRGFSEILKSTGFCVYLHNLDNLGYRMCSVRCFEILDNFAEIPEIFPKINPIFVKWEPAFSKISEKFPNLPEKSTNGNRASFPEFWPITALLWTNFE